MIEIWVPIVNDTVWDCYRPDMPGVREADGSWKYDVPWASDEAAPTDFSDPKFRPATTHFNVIVGETDVPRIRAYLQAKGKDIIADNDVPEQDKFLLAMLRTCRRNAYFVHSGEAIPTEAANNAWPSRPVTGGRVHFRPPSATNVVSVAEAEIDKANQTGALHELCGGMEEKVDAFFDALPNVSGAPPARKRMVKTILLHAVHRGLPPSRAEAIRRRLNLPEAATYGR